MLRLHFFFGARRGVEGEGKSCRPPLSSPHVPVLALELLTFRKTVFPKKNCVSPLVVAPLAEHQNSVWLSRYLQDMHQFLNC